tara:strand:+ start:1024 stop:1134 length:111 start_codon:yes stop_codon:yes gene_type:complete
MVVVLLMLVLRTRVLVAVETGLVVLQEMAVMAVQAS